MPIVQYFGMEPEEQAFSDLNSLEARVAQLELQAGLTEYQRAVNSNSNVIVCNPGVVQGWTPPMVCTVEVPSLSNLVEIHFSMKAIQSAPGAGVSTEVWLYEGTDWPSQLSLTRRTNLSAITTLTNLSLNYPLGAHNVMSASQGTRTYYLSVYHTGAGFTSAWDAYMEVNVL